MDPSAGPQIEHAIASSSPGFSGFETRVGTRFEIAGDRDSQLQLELIEVKRLGTAADSPTSVALLFRLGDPAEWTQGIVSLHHEKLGDLQIFLVPVGRDAHGLLLEAVFARAVRVCRRAAFIRRPLNQLVSNAISCTSSFRSR